MRNKFLERGNTKIINVQKKYSSNYWVQAMETHSLILFHEAAQKVPAYKDFLKANKVNPNQVKTYDDFKRVPTVNKKNYLLKYPLPMRNWNGNLSKPLVYAATSGSTGKPVYFVRDDRIDRQNALIVDLFLRQRLSQKDLPILGIICFGMGVWIGGIINYKSFDLVANSENYPLSVITPGINKEEIYNILESIAPFYNQVVLAGYPPFIKDIVDGSRDRKINLKKLNVRFLFAAEAITEEFRNYIAKNTGVKNIYKDIMNIYGSVEIGGMAYESLVSTLVRRIAHKNKNVYKSLFNSHDKFPTLAQFNPYLVNFEETEGKIVLTGDGAIPLIRYDIGDNGGVLSYSEVESILKQHGYSIEKEARSKNISESIQKLPFVYVFERADLSTTFYGLWIYPEWIKPALLKPRVSNFLSGKFTLVTRYDKKSDQYIEINLEMLPNKKYSKALEETVSKYIIKSLSMHSSEYNEIINHIGKRAYPILKFWNYEDPNYFSGRGKQQWIERENN